ncbi:hypothetical protein SYNTR_0298 [Candidatus Syntrophocurvum alkaliphilum]|uniref:Uncharacterized protein n=1 Tax=Candidatus Syntrophocurvum alkaliphilum TaxID=2293317 RepID=A0A6I6DEF0_9FIRM|nr:ABC transporter permease [Candidatus Syntrophocurvum alkaliphilum]QGT98891.1 hypothetical protein SYNTR_0298 [Candidatus Syntrophocurvum alkaliphilum]
MREYILYSILIYLPIGSLLGYFLYRYNFSKKNIYCYILAIWLLIMLFPISLVNLGVLLTMAGYLIVFSFLSYFLIKFSSDNMIDVKNKREDEIKNDEIDNNIEVSDQKKLKTICKEEDINLNTCPKEVNNNIYHIYSNGVDNDNTNENNVKNDAENDKDLNNLQDIINKEKFNISHYIEEVENAEHIEHIEDVENTENIEHIEDIEENKKDNDNLKTEDMKDINQLNESIPEAEENIEFMEHIEDIKEEHIESEENNNQKIESLLEIAFELKSKEKLLEASKQFYEAWKLTNELDLKYMLTWELIGIYQDQGLYDEVNAFLTEYLSLLPPDTSIYKELQHKRLFFEFTKQELEKVGMSKVPISDVPRLVRIRVAEQLHLQLEDSKEGSM